MLSSGPPGDRLPIFNEIRAADGIHTHIGVHKNIEYSSYKPCHICMYTCTKYVRTYVRVYVCMYAHLYVCTYICVVSVCMTA